MNSTVQMQVEFLKMDQIEKLPSANTSSPKKYKISILASLWECISAFAFAQQSSLPRSADMGLPDSFDMNHLYISCTLIKDHQEPHKNQERCFTTKDGGPKAWMSTWSFGIKLKYQSLTL